MTNFHETSPLLSSGHWHTPYNSDDDDFRDCRHAHQRPASVNDVTINVAYQHSNSVEVNYTDYNRHIERPSFTGNRGVTSETRVYATRWYLLFVLSLSVTLQNAVWSTWGPIADSAKAVYGWNTSMVTIMINCGNLGVLLSLLFAGYLVTRKGLRVSMVTCTFLLALGSGLRTITTRQQPGTILIGIGQFFNGVAGSISQVIPSALSETWFPSNERATATAVGILANTLGSLVSFTLGPNVVDDIGNASSGSYQNVSENSTMYHKTEVEQISHQIHNLMFIEFGVGAGVFLLTLIYFPAKPTRSPSQSALVKRMDFSTGIINVFKKPSVLLIATSGAVPWAVYGNWMGLINVNLHDIGVTQHQAGLFGMYGSVGGLVGGFLTGRIADNLPRRLKRMLLFLYVLSLASAIWITCMRNGYLYRSTVLLAVGITLLCVFMAGTVPLCYELTCEVGYPVHEGLIGTFIGLGINLSAVCFLLVQLVPDIGVYWMNWVLIGVLVASISCLVLGKERYNRSDVDDEINVRVQKDKR